MGCAREKDENGEAKGLRGTGAQGWTEAGPLCPTCRVSFTIPLLLEKSLWFCDLG